MAKASDGRGPWGILSWAESLGKVRTQTVITYLCLGFDSWTMAIAWQEHDQGVYERLGVAGRAEVEASHGNAPAARLFLASAIQYARANRLVDFACVVISVV